MRLWLIYFVAIKIIHGVSSSRTVDAQEKDVPPSRLADEWITRILLGDGRTFPLQRKQGVHLSLYLR